MRGIKLYYLVIIFSSLRWQFSVAVCQIFFKFENFDVVGIFSGLGALLDFLRF